VSAYHALCSILQHKVNLSDFRAQLTPAPGQSPALCHVSKLTLDMNSEARTALSLITLSDIICIALLLPLQLKTLFPRGSLMGTEN
jgi:hypothetical protein